MTFYNKKMVNNANLMKAWRAAHDIKSKEDVTNLPEVCEEIESHLRRHRHPCSRLSLRTSSELLTGASRLYLDQAELLMRDAFKLAYGPTSAPPEIGLSYDFFYSESSVEPSSSLRSSRNTIVQSASSYNKTESTIDDDESNSMSSSSAEASISGEAETPDDDVDDITEASTVFTASADDEPYDSSVSSTPHTKDQAVQTDSNPTGEKILEEDLDPNLPFGHILIYNSLGSRIPSMFMFSNLNEKVKNIIYGSPVKNKISK